MLHSIELLDNYYPTPLLSLFSPNVIISIIINEFNDFCIFIKILKYLNIAALNLVFEFST